MSKELISTNLMFGWACDFYRISVIENEMLLGLFDLSFSKHRFATRYRFPENIIHAIFFNKDLDVSIATCCYLEL